jgi:GT2 family glycosyltransferase
MQPIGVVVIGRNEGKRLHQCLLSLASENVVIVYVDSGSTDGSVALATSLGVYVIELDLSIPFTAARSRNVGFEHLASNHPDIAYVQFIDGDCRIAPGWLESAVNELNAQPDVVVVCGRRREEFPEYSIYNRLCEIEWNTPVGEAKACGGDSMMRVSALQAVGGFNGALIAGEEPELCVRLRQAGGRIIRIHGDMTWHDAQIKHLRQWWKRLLRSGYAYAQGAWLHGEKPERHWVKESLSIWIWGLGVPLVALALAGITYGLSLIAAICVYTLSWRKIYVYLRNQGFTVPDAQLYSWNCILAKFPQLQGQIQFHIWRLLKRQATLVEYKNIA